MQKTEKNETGIPDVDFYILKFGAEKQERLQKIRKIAHEEIFNVTERIYYGIPTIEIDVNIVMQYAAYKKHVSILCGKILPAIFKEKYPHFHFTEYSIVFPDSEPFPEDFVREICKAGGDEAHWAEKSNKKTGGT